VQTIEDLERKNGQLMEAARAVYRENHQLRELLATFGGVARLVLEEADRFAEENGLLPADEEPEAPSRGEGDGDRPLNLPAWDTARRPDDAVIADWASLREQDVTAGEIARHYGVPVMRVVAYIRGWVRRQEEDEHDVPLRQPEDEDAFIQDEIGGVR